jgi:hypothetical protein
MRLLLHHAVSPLSIGLGDLKVKCRLGHAKGVIYAVRERHAILSNWRYIAKPAEIDHDSLIDFGWRQSVREGVAMDLLLIVSLPLCRSYLCIGHKPEHARDTLQ